MSNFDAGQDELTYDFTKYIPDAKGVIPEPTSEQIQHFTQTLQKIMPSKTITDENGNERNVLDIEKIKEEYGEDGSEVELTLAAAVSQVCSGTPTAEQILALPYRVKRRFTGWITGTLLDPEA